MTGQESGRAYSVLSLSQPRDPCAHDSRWSVTPPWMDEWASVSDLDLDLDLGPLTGLKGSEQGQV